MSAIPFVPDPDRIQRAARLVRPLMAAHRFSTKGMEHVPRSGGCLMVVHHSLATYDGFLLGLDIWDRTGRLGRGLGDDRIFQTPRLAELAQDIGLVPASPTAGRELLDAGELVGVAPGGMWEALRPSEARYQSRWGSRRGFCRLALRAQVPMLLAAVPRADELYSVYAKPLDGPHLRAAPPAGPPAPGLRADPAAAAHPAHGLPRPGDRPAPARPRRGGRPGRGALHGGRGPDAGTAGAAGLDEGRRRTLQVAAPWNAERIRRDTLHERPTSAEGLASERPCARSRAPVASASRPARVCTRAAIMAW